MPTEEMTETKCPDKTEACYETEYALRKDIHYRKGEIEKLEYLNAKHCREIDRLNTRISKILETTPDTQETVQGDQIDRITELKSLFEYLKALLIEIPSKEGIASINPDDIDIKYIEAACRYSFPVLFDKFAVLSENERHKIELADSILNNFGIETMEMYEELIQRGDIDIKIVDNRHIVAENKHL